MSDTVNSNYKNLEVVAPLNSLNVSIPPGTEAALFQFVANLWRKQNHGANLQPDVLGKADKFAKAARNATSPQIKAKLLKKADELYESATASEDEGVANPKQPSKPIPRLIDNAAIEIAVQDSSCQSQVRVIKNTLKVKRFKKRMQHEFGVGTGSSGASGDEVQSTPKPSRPARNDRGEWGVFTRVKAHEKPLLLARLENEANLSATLLHEWVVKSYNLDRDSFDLCQLRKADGSLVNNIIEPANEMQADGGGVSTA